MRRKVRIQVGNNRAIILTNAWPEVIKEWLNNNLYDTQRSIEFNTELLKANGHFARVLYDSSRHSPIDEEIIGWEESYIRAESPMAQKDEKQELIDLLQDAVMKSGKRCYEKNEDGFTILLKDGHAPTKQIKITVTEIRS